MAELLTERGRALSDEQVASYREQGYLLVQRVFPREDVEAMRAEVADLLGRAESAQRDLNATWRGDYIDDDQRSKLSVLSVHDLQFHSALFSRLLVDDRLTAIFADLVGPNVQLHHNKLHVKPPEKGSPFPMHQDYPYFPHKGTSVAAAIVHIDDATVENGCVWVAPGSHKLGPLVHEEGNYLRPEEWPLERGVPCAAQAGDVLAFSYLTVHGSGVNRSSRSRTIWLVQVRDAEATPLADVHRSPGQGTMLRGVNPVRFSEQARAAR
jgi:phytanoyl-CoA hydroxylase